MKKKKNPLPDHVSPWFRKCGHFIPEDFCGHSGSMTLSLIGCGLPQGREYAWINMWEFQGFWSCGGRKIQKFGENGNRTNKFFFFFLHSSQIQNHSSLYQKNVLSQFGLGSRLAQVSMIAYSRKNSGMDRKLPFSLVC